MSNPSNATTPSVLRTRTGRLVTSFLVPLSLLAVTAAGAADMYPVRAPVAAVPGFSWTGFYVGGFAGAGGDTNRTSQTFDPIGNKDVGMIPGAGQGGQWLTSSTYNTGIARASALNNAPFTPSSFTPPSYPNAPIDLSGLANRFSALGGAELGYNQQFGGFVLGFAADIAFMAKKNGNGDWNSNGSYSGTGYQYNGGSSGCTGYCTTTSTVYGNSGASGGTSASLDWLGTVRAKAGFAADRFMVYGTGGLAYGKVQMSSSANWSDTNNLGCLNNWSGNTCASAPIGTTSTSASWGGSLSTTKTGYVAGAGAAYAVTNNLIVNVEALYYDLGTSTLTVNGSGTRTVTGAYIPAPNSTGAASVASYTVEKKFDGVIGKVGVSYKF